MKKIISILLMIILLAVSISVWAAAGDENQDNYVRVFITFTGAPDESAVYLAGGEVIYNYNLLKNVLAAYVPAEGIPGLLLHPDIARIEYDSLVSAATQDLPWGVDRIDAEQSNYTGAGITVCVVDSGIEKDHPDLQANIIGGRNFVTDGGPVKKVLLPLHWDEWDDENGHGTKVAGVIAAIDNTEGVVGVAPEASLLIAKVLDYWGNGYISDVVAGIDYCVNNLNNKAKIISMSLETSEDSSTFHDAVDAAYDAGALLVGAAGNGYGSNVSYPAAYSSVIAVSATQSNDSLADFSNAGSEIEFSAPGVSVLTTWMHGSYKYFTGTSAAAPHVSGVAALAWEANPTYNNSQIRQLLRDTADDLGPSGLDNGYGYGLVDAELQ